MQRTIVFSLLLFLATGCGAGGRNALFSTNTTRVPPPATKSYGTADNGYYNGNAPRGFSNNSDPSGINSGMNPLSAGNGANQPGDLNWRAPGSRNNPVAPAVAQLPSVPGTTNGVAPASYSAPFPQSQPWMRSNENPVRVVEGGPVGTGVAPQAFPGSMNNGAPPSAATYGPSSDSNDIANLPKVTNMPRIRLPNSGFPNDPTMPPATTYQPPAASSSPTLNWRNQP